MIKVGEIAGYDVMYDKDTDSIGCKNIVTTGTKIVSAYESGLDRVTIEKNLVLRKFENRNTLGCFEISIEDSNKLIKTIKKSKR